MRLSGRRVRAIVGKELRDFRRNRSLTVSMAIVPVLFCVQPLVAVFTLDPAASTALGQEHCAGAQTALEPLDFSNDLCHRGAHAETCAAEWIATSRIG